MEHNLQVGDTCPQCLSAGLAMKLRLFHINLQEQILKCESASCMYPYDDEVSSDDDDAAADNLSAAVANTECATSTASRVQQTAETQLRDNASFIDTLLRCDDTSATPFLNFDFSQFNLPEQDDNDDVATCMPEPHAVVKQLNDNGNESALKDKQNGDAIKANNNAPSNVLIDDVKLNMSCDNVDKSKNAVKTAAKTLDFMAQVRTTKSTHKRQSLVVPRSSANIVDSKLSNTCKPKAAQQTRSATIDTPAKHKSVEIASEPTPAAVKQNASYHMANASTDSTSEAIPKASIAGYFKAIEANKTEKEYKMRGSERRSIKARRMTAALKKQTQPTTTSTKPKLALDEVLSVIKRKT